MPQGIDQDLPDEIQEQVGDELDQKQKRIADLSMLVARKRDEAIAGRAASGIEQIWEEDEDSYEGFDDANRQESGIIKGATKSSGLMRRARPNQTRSTMFLNITRPYVDSAAARVADMLLPTDDRAFEIKPDPIPDVTPFKDDESIAVHPVSGQVATNTVQGPQGPQQVPLTKADLAKELMDRATVSAEAAQTRIDDWLTECNFHAEKRKSIHDCAKLGIGILKGPIPIKRTRKAASRTNDGMALAIEETITPASKRISPWNLYPDPACGENIHNGNYIVELDTITERQLRDLIGVPGYLESQILECIKEGPNKENITDREGKDKKSLYTICYYYGAINTDDLVAADCDLMGKDGDTQFAVISMVNDRVIKSTLNHLDSGEFPYDAMPWQVRSGTWTGIGVARQMRAPQGMIVAGSRNMMDNAALSGGPILAIDRTKLEPADDDWTITPRKIFYTIGEDGIDVRQAIATFDIPSKQQELMGIINFAMQMAEQVTGLPMLLQGQSGNAPDTLGGQILANNNASTVLRRMARLDDDLMTVPHIQRYYEWLLIYGPEESEKGQFSVDARGSSVLVERDIQNHATIQMLQLSTNPAFGADPKKAFAEACRVQRLDPKRFQFTEEEQAKMAAMPPVPPLPVQIEQIKGQNAMQLQQAKSQAELQVAQQEAQLQAQQLQNGGTSPHMASAMANIEREKIRAATAQTVEASRSNAEQARAEKEQQIAYQNGQFEIQKLQLQKELAILQYAHDNQQTLEETKAQLADRVMQEQTKRQLAGAEIELAQNEGHQDRLVDLHKHNTSLVRDEMSTPVTP